MRTHLIYKSEAQLEVEIRKLSDELTALREANASDYVGEDLALQTAMKKLSKAYEDRDILAMKNNAAYIAEIRVDRAPDMPDAEREWNSIITGGIGIPFPPNWNLPKDIVKPKGKFVVYGGKQKTGKTRAACSDVLYLAEIGHRVAFASCEMPPEQVWLLLWMQKQFLDFRNSFSEISVRHMFASKDAKFSEVRNHFKEFRKEYGNKIFIIHTPGWTARRILYACKLSENVFGKPETIRVIDYAQLIQKDASIRDMREGQIANSLLLSNTTGQDNVGMILVSQLNEAGNTAESVQYERDAGMVINFIREEDKATGEKSPVIKIHVKHSRSTASGIFDRWLDVKSGAIVPDAGYTPPERQQRFV